MNLTNVHKRGKLLANIGSIRVLFIVLSCRITISIDFTHILSTFLRCIILWKYWLRLDVPQEMKLCNSLVLAKSTLLKLIVMTSCNRGKGHKFKQRYHYTWFSSLQSFSHVWLFATPWTAAHQASLSITNSWSLLKLIGQLTDATGAGT